jgi:hypothetical protein
MTRKEAATIMSQTAKQHQYWWLSAKNEKASKNFLRAQKVYKEKVNEDSMTRREFLKWMIGQ